MQFELGSIVLAVSVLIGAIIWFVRLEGRVNTLEKTVNSLEVKVAKQEQKLEDFDDKIVNKLSEIEKSLARLEGRMQIDIEQRK